MTTLLTQLDFTQYENLLLRQDGTTLHITLNRPESRNAMSLHMVEELLAVFNSIQASDIYTVVLCGAGGHFCAGGDIKDMAMARQKALAGDVLAFQTLNRTFGHLITTVNHAPQTVVAVVEGAVLGGGFGLTCVSDVAIASANAQFGLPETGLGVIPAQIIPFVVQRVGLSQARYLALLGAKFAAAEALRLGVVHQLATSEDDLNQQLLDVLAKIKRCAPIASRTTKALLHRVEKEPLEPLLDDAARLFAQAVSSAEGMEGTMAFVQKRLPSWAQ